ncbi:GIY-YIG nuclease family protein [Patescibacteria group bacterium]
MRKSRLDYEFYLYFMASPTGTLYVGVTNNLVKRVWQHKNKKIKGFTEKYSCNKLVYYEIYQYVYDALAREKQIKRWNRKKKENLIKKINPHWKDLSENWFKE